MKKSGKEFSVAAWSAIALGAIGVGVIVAFVAGYFLGHFTGHEKTTTISATSSSTPGETSAEAEPAAMLEVGETSSLPKAAPTLTQIGAGLKGISGLEAKVFTSGVANVESLTPGPQEGSYFASTAAEEGPNGVYLLEEGAKPKEVIKGLKPTIGLLWHDNQLYVSTYGEVIAYSDWNGNSFASHRPVVSNLPAGELGWNGDIKAGPDGRIYLAIGSPCDHCKPKSPLSATIVSFEPDGSDMKTFAKGLRGNAFFEFAPQTGTMFAVSNERDDVPINDEFVLVQEGDEFGFPACKHHFGSESSCEGVVQPLAEMDAHGAQNGIAFVEGEWGAATEGLSAVSTEWTLGKVIQTTISEEGNVVTAKPQQIIGGFKNPSAVINSSDDPTTLLIADYGTGKVYAVSPGEGGGEAAEEEPAEAQPEGKEGSEGAAKSAPPAQGSAKAAGKVAVDAEPSGELKFTQAQLSAKAGKVEIDFENKSPVPHNVAIEAGGKVLGETKVISEGADNTVLSLKPGTYTYFCTVPGHREAGMEGTLTVK